MTTPGPPQPLLCIGRYELHEEIASGGMAVVHLGRQVGDAGFARTVAIKRLHPQFARDAGFVDMLLDEAHLAARISHPNVVSPTDVVASDDELFVVMDYVEGVTLNRLLATVQSRSETVPLAVAVRIAVDALAGLHAAHEARDEHGESLHIVHRDVSPQNIMVSRDGRSRVLDFGIAKAAVRLQTTREGQLKGKLAYMAPEQLQDGPVGQRVDVYAASVMLWELLTSRGLFRADSEAALLGKVLEAPVMPPSRFNPEVSAELDAVVTRGLDRHPESRFATADDMLRALEQALSPASHRQVAAWVEELLGPELDSQRTRVMAIESGDVSISGRPQPSSPELEPSDDEATVTRTLPVKRSLQPALARQSEEPAPPKRFRPWWVPVAAVAGLAVGWAIFAAGTSGDAAPTATPGGSSTEFPNAVPAPTGSAPTAMSAVPTPSASSVAASSTEPENRPRPPRRGARRTAVPDCSQLYYRDQDGIRRVKRECL